MADALTPGVAVVVIDRDKNRTLAALTAAALCLPGMEVRAGSPATQAEGNTEFGYYQESNQRMQVELFHADGLIPLTDRLELSFNLDRDTYSGASPAWSMPSTMLNQPLTASGKGADIISSATTISDLSLKTHIESFQAYNDVINAGGSVKSAVANVLNSAVPSATQTVQHFQLQPLETRSQPVLGLKYYWNDSTLGISGGLSDEPDYLSNFGGLNFSHDFNEHNTVLSAGYNVTRNAIFRNQSMSMSPAGVGLGMAMTDMCGQSSEDCKKSGLLNANSLFNSLNLGLTQVISKNTLFNASAGYTNQSGFLDNAYKTVYVRGLLSADDYVNKIFNHSSAINWNTLAPLEIVGVDLFREKRPGERNQLSLSSGLNHYIPVIDAAVHLDYRFYFDDWNINSHTFELKWFQNNLPFGITATPSIRYYSQSQADFFAPYFLAPRADNHYSSDYRLSAFGSLSGGITFAKQIAKGVKLDAGVEYYKHASDLKLGGGGSGSYADYSYYLAHAGVNINMSAPGSLFEGAGNVFESLFNNNDEHAHHHHSHQTHMGSLPPSGVMFGHMMQQSDDIMVGYMYMYGGQAGTMLHNSDAVSDATLASGSSVNISKAQALQMRKGATAEQVLNPQQLAGLSTDACPGYAHANQSIIHPKAIDYGCLVKPTSMSMGMHMFDIMYAPTNWLNLMLMPQLVDMSMNMSSDLRTPVAMDAKGNNLNVECMDVNCPPSMYANMHHSVFDLGDTIMMALIKLYDDPNHHLHLGIGGSAPTGSVSEVHYTVTSVAAPGSNMGSSYPTNIHILQDFGMQAGSGTWDLKPNLTYTGQEADVFWGAQFSSVNRMQNRNVSGYALGDIYQGTTWLGYKPFEWLNTTVRGVYTQQNKLRGDIYQLNAAQVLNGSNPNQIGHDVISTVDYPQNSGGHYWDIGLGMRVNIPKGNFAGHTLAIEWLQPVKDYVNGYQLERTGGFSATWTYMF